jgi:8-oxo-dGTP pyrophosphatase MutT (NUDIX family)
LSSSSFSSEHNLCSNCGNPGHGYHQCKHPITSVGIIAFRKMNEELQYLMIRRKDTIGYIEFMRGKYSVYNKLYVTNLLSEMTIDEKKKIMNVDFDVLWKELWGENSGMHYRSEEKLSREKFELLKIGVNNINGPYNLQSLLDETNTNWIEAEWGFPKGRHNHQEKDLLCGLREFEEETGYMRTSLTLVQNLIPFEEIFTGSNYKSYKHKYFLACMTTPDVNERLTTYQKSEVSKLEWKNYAEAIQSIRPYNLEKIEILIRVNKLLNEYKII